MDGDFQLQYQAAERAYGAGDYPEARRLAGDLLNQLGDQPQDPDTQAAVLGWRAFVALLLGHIDLHGLENPAGAVDFYQQVLDSQPQETLAELAQQGLERCQRAITAAGTAIAVNSPSPDSRSQNSRASQPETAVVPPRQMLPELLRDPFLTQQPASTAGPDQATDQNKPTAMPWLDADDNASMADLEPEPKLPVLDVPQALPDQAAEISPEPELAAEPPTASEPTQTPTPTPSPTPGVGPAPTPSPAPTPPPPPTPTPDPQADAPATAAAPPEGSREQATETPQKTSKAAVNGAEIDPAAVLAGSLLRVTIQPKPNNDSATTPLDRPADSLLLRLWQRLSGRR